jgi:ADP-dependent NAD(P)H-hydrate dehydratase / NAD(P)H-hydrate epimerase
MRYAHGVAKVRTAEHSLMAQLPPGTLMQRAAAGLASVCAGLAGGTVPGSRVVVLTGSGDNGGDALYAGARLARRGASVLAVRAAARIHEEGAAALRAAGGRLAAADDSAVAAAIGAADLIIDGLLGIGGRGCASRRRRWPGWPPSPRRPWWPWTCPAGWTRTPG